MFLKSNETITNCPYSTYNGTVLDLVHQLQPACLVNGRLGHGIGDYGQTEDNDIPAGRMEQAFEVPASINVQSYFTKRRN